MLPEPHRQTGLRRAARARGAPSEHPSNGVDRVAARACRALESEGLVEGGRSRAPRDILARHLHHSSDGHTLAADALHAGGDLLVAVGACRRDDVVRVRGGCIESNEDHLVTLTSEIEGMLSLETVRIYVDPAADEGNAICSANVPRSRRRSPSW